MTIAKTQNSSYNLITNEYVPTLRPAAPRKLFEGEVDSTSGSQLLTEDEVDVKQSNRNRKLSVDRIA